MSGARAKACPACGPRQEVDLEPVSGAGALAGLLLKDWRTWVVAFGAFMVTGMIGGALGLRGDALGAGAGAFVGLWLAVRVQRARRCKACKKVVHDVR